MNINVKSRKNKRGAIQQVFIYILVALTVASILLIGYKSINGILKNSCETDKIRFIEQLNEIGGFYYEYGLVKKIEIKAPCNYDLICIINSSDNRIGNLHSAPTILESAWSNNVAQNIFLSKFGEDHLEAAGISEYLAAEDGWICINSSGGIFSFKVRGTGKYAVVEK